MFLGWMAVFVAFSGLGGLAGEGATLVLARFATGVAAAFLVHLQEVRGWSSTQTGLALAVAGIDAVLAPTLAPVLVRRFGHARVLVAGPALAAAAHALYLPVAQDGTYALMLPALLVLGLAFALAYGPLTIAATDGVADHEQGLASGIVTMSFQFGAALGLAVATAVVVATGGGAVTPDTVTAGLWVALAGAAAGVAATLPGALRR